jgi:hypothetical protein
MYYVHTFVCTILPILHGSVFCCSRRGEGKLSTPEFRFLSDGMKISQSKSLGKSFLAALRLSSNWLEPGPLTPPFKTSLSGFRGTGSGREERERERERWRKWRLRGRKCDYYGIMILELTDGSIEKGRQLSYFSHENPFMIMKMNFTPT